MENDDNECLCRMSKTLAAGRANDHDQVTNRVKCRLCSIESPKGKENSLCSNTIPLDVSVCQVTKWHAGEPGVGPSWVYQKKNFKSVV